MSDTTTSQGARRIARHPIFARLYGRIAAAVRKAGRQDSAPGIIPDWDEYWDRYFLYELRDVPGGVTPSSDSGAVLEDLGYGNAMYWSGPEPPVHALWTAVTMPALVLRARREILPGFGFILPATEAERFAAAVPSARVADIDANHYAITTHDDSIAAIGAFLRTT